ncbi:MAG: SDR family oxidoreductase [Actinobacteria bacterium]|nr:SDR family oxidoreductase [Actinomycetota bacterium]
MPTTETPVLVTGATGFVAAEIVKQLLEAGYRVRGTTRDVARSEADGHLAALSGAGERLELLEADLVDPGAFDTAVLGCVYVIHTASPFVLDVEDPQRDLVDPAVNGTTSVLESVSKTGDVRRVVLTSSFAAMSGEPKDSPWSEDDWNDVSSLDSGAYAYSKTMAERAAWDFMGDNDRSFDLVVINPTGVIGPSIVPRLNQSHSVFVSATNGEIPGIIDLSFPIVDVRDVAKAHILAMENPGAAGRYLCSAETRSMRQNFELLKEAGFGEGTNWRPCHSTMLSGASWWGWCPALNPGHPRLRQTLVETQLRARHVEDQDRVGFGVPRRRPNGHRHNDQPRKLGAPRQEDQSWCSTQPAVASPTSPRICLPPHASTPHLCAERRPPPHDRPALRGGWRPDTGVWTG